MENKLQFLKEIDFYGKEPEFYLKGKPKKVTIIGRIFTILYILLYIVFFVYKLIRLFNRSDLQFFDSDSEGSETLSMHITQEDFYFNLGFVNSETGEPFLDETIFQPLAFFDNEPVEIKPCTIDKFGSHYQELFDEPNLDQYYCFQDFDYTLTAYVDSFYIQVLTCQNSTENNNHCKPQEEIDEHIDGNDMMVRLQDVLIRPQNFSNPVERRITDVYSYLFKNIGQYIYIEIQIANIETNTNLIGFDFLTEEKSETYIRYDLVSTVPTPGYQDNRYPICEIEIQLKDKYFAEKRIYTQLFDVLGEVGGFMESISSFFGLICSVIVNILYENEITNYLFSFDLQKKVIKIKNDGKITKYNIHDINELDEEQQKDEKNEKLNLNMNLRNPKMNRKSLDDKYTNISINSNSENNFNIKGKANLVQNSKNNEVIKKRRKRKAATKLESDKSVIIYNSQKKEEVGEIKDNYNNHNDNTNNNNQIINEINLNQFLVHLGFCCVRSRRNYQNILLDESRFLLEEKLDIINIFKKMCLSEEIQYRYRIDKDIIQMSDECKNSLAKLNLNY